MTASYSEILGHLGLAEDPVRCPQLIGTGPETRSRRLSEGADTAEIVALERAHRLGADHVYFRAVDGRWTPAAWLFDRCTERPGLADLATPEARADLHRRVWCAGEVPFAFVLGAATVDIYHVLQGPSDVNGRPAARPWEQVDLLAGASAAIQSLRALSIRALVDGRLWEEHPKAAGLSFGGAAFMSLAAELGRCRGALVALGMPDALVRRLLVLFVMVQYLDERRDRSGRGVFPPGTFERHAPAARCFVDLLRAGGAAVATFLDELASKDRLNGSIFSLAPGERTQMLRADLRHVADFLEGRNQGSQLMLWRRYAFAELPVELISHVYEQFLPRQPGVVYTPPFLVQVILDEVLPLSGSTPADFRLVDPACGSGVFLVGAFKRLVQRWRRENEFGHPDVRVLQSILRNHLYGVDSSEDAVRLTAFSLSVALCDFLEPRVIWEELHFEDLVGVTLHCDDYFGKCVEWERGGAGTFDLVVGNPPFLSKLSDPARSTLGRIQREDPEFDLPDNQVALLFLESALRAARPDGKVALVQPSRPLLYNANSGRFRAHLLARRRVRLIVDLTSLARVLFRRAPGARRREERESNNRGDTPVALFFAERAAPVAEPVLHVTVRRTVASDLKLSLEVDAYDFHHVSQQEARSEADVWKANLMGGGRILPLVRRMRAAPSLGAALRQKRKSGKWDFGEGFIRGEPAQALRRRVLEERAVSGALSDAEGRDLARLRKRYRKADWLAGTRPVINNSLTAVESAAMDQEYFAEPRRPSLFEAPLLLVRETMQAATGQIPTRVSAQPVLFTHRVFGIHCPPEHVDLLPPLEKFLGSALARFHLLATSSELLVGRSSAFLARDLLGVPFSFDGPGLSLSELENVLIDDVVKWLPDAQRRGPTSAIYERPRREEIDSFARWFCRVLGTVYPDVSAGSATVLSRSVCLPIWFGGERDPDQERALATEAGLEALLAERVGPALTSQRVIRAFLGNLLLIVKPRMRRYWLRSVAVRDADEAFAHLQASGY